MTLSDEFKKAIWVQDIIEELEEDLTNQAVIFLDSQSAIFLS